MKKIVKIEELPDEDFVVYSDTDSCFTEAVPMIQAMMPEVDISNEDEMTKAIMSVTGEVQTYVNTFYDRMAVSIFNLTEKRFDSKTHTFDAKQEVISKTSFWLAKKRYAQWIIHKEGSLLKEPELEVKGIDIVRSSFPLSFRDFMKQFVIKVLTNASQMELDDLILSFKETIPSIPIIELSKNTSVKFIGKNNKNYNPEDRQPFRFIDGSPAQVKAALGYIDLLKKWELNKQYEPIYNGQKIKFCYLQQNPFQLDALAFKADGTDPKQIIDYITKYIDKNKMYERELETKLKDFYGVLNYQMPNSSMKIAAKFFEF